jgi:cytidine deaminase
MATPLGEFTRFADLNEIERAVVLRTWEDANSSAEHNLCFRSHFPVGSTIYAANKDGDAEFFPGCNVENDYFPATICAERNAATTATRQGYTKFLYVGVLCRNYPGGSPCGPCRQVLNQWGRDAVLLNIADTESNVRRATVGDLLPPANGPLVAHASLEDEDRRLVKRLLQLKASEHMHVPYSKRRGAALFVAENKNGHRRVFSGLSDDNSSYGASALAEAIAMRTARTAGYRYNPRLITAVEHPQGINQVEGECLQVLREFAADAPILLVGADYAVASSLDALLPDAFGPEGLS